MSEQMMHNPNPAPPITVESMRAAVEQMKALGPTNPIVKIRCSIPWYTRRLAKVPVTEAASGFFTGIPVQLDLPPDHRPGFEVVRRDDA